MSYKSSCGCDAPAPAAAAPNTSVSVSVPVPAPTLQISCPLPDCLPSMVAGQADAPAGLEAESVLVADRRGNLYNQMPADTVAHALKKAVTAAHRAGDISQTNEDHLVAFLALSDERDPLSMIAPADAAAALFEAANAEDLAPVILEALAYALAEEMLKVEETLDLVQGFKGGKPAVITVEDLQAQLNDAIVLAEPETLPVSLIGNNADGDLNRYPVRILPPNAQQASGGFAGVVAAGVQPTGASLTVSVSGTYAVDCRLAIYVTNWAGAGYAGIGFRVLVNGQQVNQNDAYLYAAAAGAPAGNPDAYPSTSQFMYLNAGDVISMVYFGADLMIGSSINNGAAIIQIQSVATNIIEVNGVR